MLYSTFCIIHASTSHPMPPMLISDISRNNNNKKYIIQHSKAYRAVLQLKRILENVKNLIVNLILRANTTNKKIIILSDVFYVYTTFYIKFDGGKRPRFPFSRGQIKIPAGLVFAQFTASICWNSSNVAYTNIICIDSFRTNIGTFTSSTIG